MLYSLFMNWPTITFGASIVYFPKSANDKQANIKN